MREIDSGCEQSLMNLIRSETRVHCIVTIIAYIVHSCALSGYFIMNMYTCPFTVTQKASSKIMMNEIS